MKTQLLIRRYTQGLVEALKDEQEFLTLSRELSGFEELLSSHKQLLEVLAYPFFSQDKKIQIIKDILAKKKFSQKMKRFILALTENNRLELLPEILELLPSRWNEKKGIFTYEVFSAVPLKEAQKKELKKRLESLEKGPVFLKYSIDPELIGGLCLRKGNLVYDISLRGSLAKMKEEIIEG
ncbi:MAG: ATP synthase F1 subunit delta [Candidatus Aminicenantes bacterium]|nr:ATP synthase F1 subunit delta [Candidatus Aminicenantes bacterium]